MRVVRWMGHYLAVLLGILMATVTLYFATNLVLVWDGGCLVAFGYAVVAPVRAWYGHRVRVIDRGPTQYVS